MIMSPAEPIPETADTADRSRRQRRERLVLLALLGAVAAGLVGLAAGTGWRETLARIGALSGWQLLVLLALSLANYLLRGLRWHVLARRLGLGTTLGQNLRHFLGGFAMSVTPGRVGELVRMRWIRRETGWDFARTAPLALVDRASDLAAMAVLLGIGLAFSLRGIAGALPVALLALATAVVATRPRLLELCADTGFRLAGRRWPRVFARIRAAARALACFSGPGMLGLAALIGAAGWFAEAWAFHLLLGWMGADTGLASATAIFVFATLAGGLTGAPGGLGGAEAAMIALLALEGVPLETAVAATAVIRASTLWFAIAIGLALFPLAERRSRQVRDALEGN